MKAASAGALRFRLTLGRRIRLIRQQRGWSQEVLAELADLHRSYVGAVERLACALDITLCRLVGCAEEEGPSVTGVIAP